MSTIELLYYPSPSDDIEELVRLSDHAGKLYCRIPGWLSWVERGRYNRRISHTTTKVVREQDYLRLTLDPNSTDVGARLRRIYDELGPLFVRPYLRGPTTDHGERVWREAHLVSWDVVHNTTLDTDLDRFLRAVDRG